MNVSKVIKTIAISLVSVLVLSGCDAAKPQDSGNPQDAKQIDILGTVISVTRNQSGDILGTIYVEGETGFKPYDKASIKVTQKTRIYEKTADQEVNAIFDSLKKDQRVEVSFIGPVAESYPVQATAGEITILNDEQADKRASLGGIRLGDSQSQVDKVLGSAFKEEVYDEPGHFPEAWKRRVYDNGMTIIIGKNSGQVLELETTSAQFPTNRGVKTGDMAKDVFDNYGSDYKQMESRHGEGMLEGFYELGEGQLIIFDLDKADNSLLNQNVKADSRVEMIRLTRDNFID
ncbi:DUF3221 domain-containing protein [Desulfosporosinus youngiae]|uniref:Uncharacterized protein n=1 Tax=Desulfosporosinus youngiae DSM 17734 TaxID=768710 RepID=H5XWH1_9FIRM|nr:DUF3221 domain-containing protein [Desulfosporosinus youngiae]EHQ90340.1 hypothetical protein DesyoDRAFT_3310 [Desulfosporosinus youngiae DSM 17734]